MSGRAGVFTAVECELAKDGNYGVATFEAKVAVSRTADSFVHEL